MMTWENHLHDTTHKWFAIYTRFKREKTVLKSLTAQGIEAYLPIQKVVRQWERKTKTVELPLINCYVFVKITKSQYKEVLSTRDVVTFVKFSKNLIAIPEEEITLMRRVIGEYDQIEMAPICFKEGEIVEIISGNLTGIKGKLITQRSKHEVVIALERIGFQMQISVEPSLLRKVAAYI